jgi:Family of unknown function (DUF6520)
MKRVSMVLSVMVFVSALGAAFATSSAEVLITEVWRKPMAGGICEPTACLLTGGQPCGVSGYTYFNNSGCLGTNVSPMRN